MNTTFRSGFASASPERASRVRSAPLQLDTGSVPKFSRNLADKGVHHAFRHRTGHAAERHAPCDGRRRRASVGVFLLRWRLGATALAPGVDDPYAGAGST